MTDSTEKYLEYARKIIQWGTDRYICGPEGQGTAIGQAIKCVEEAAELLVATVQQDSNGIVDGIGDTFVTMVMVSERMGVDLESWISVVDSGARLRISCANAAFRNSGTLIEAVADNRGDFVRLILAQMMATLSSAAASHNLTMVECMEAAWNEIKDRKGRMVNGKFAKEAV